MIAEAKPSRMPINLIRSTVGTGLAFGLLACGTVPADLAITDVTVINPPTGEVAAGQTVVVAEGVIRSVSSSSVDGKPAASTVVDGSGHYLIPGLWDMHAHLDGHADTDLVMLVVNGVLNIRDMGGDPFVLADTKSRISEGEIVGPGIRGAGSILEDRGWLTRARETFDGLENRVPVDNPEEARATVAMLKSWGADLVKVRNVTDEATLHAILAAARDHGLTVAGHEPMIVDIDTAAQLGMTTFEHVPFITLTMPGREADDARVALAIEGLLASGSYIDPTLIASNGLGKSREERAAAIEADDERYQYLPDSVREMWVASLAGDAGPLPWGPMRDRSLEMAKQMHDAGIPILAGTDMGVPLTFPGSSLLGELVLLVGQLGLSPMAALEAATSAPASLFGIAEGSVAPGMAANLVLLRADPLADITNVSTIEAVILRGELHDRAQLDSLLDYVRENKDAPPGPTVFEQLEASCRAEETPVCLERLAGYMYSRTLYADARGVYQEALDAGAGASAIEGLFASTVNVFHEGGLECGDEAGALEGVLAARPGDPDKIVGVLDRILPAIGAECVKEQAAYLTRLAEIEESALTEEMRSIYREHYASYLFKVEGDGDAAYEYRQAHMPEGWEGNHIQLRELAEWCLVQGVALPQARALAQKAAQVTEIPLVRLMSMMLEARIASAAGDHDDAVELMETIDRAVPDNQTVMGLLEGFRKLAGENDG